MAERSITITLETIFDLLRREKSREDLQKLETSFYQDIVHYLGEKKALMQSQQKSIDFFTETDKERSLIQYNNIKKMIRDLYERREKKIIMMALNKSKTNAALIDTTSLLDEERIFYEELVYLFNKFRQDIVMNLVEGIRPRLRNVVEKEVEKQEITPEVAPEVKETFESKPAETSTPSETSLDVPPKIESITPQIKPEVEKAETETTIENPKIEEPKVEPTSEPKPDFKTGEEIDQENKGGVKMVRFLKPIPKFVGEELEVYGPFEEDDVANLPEKIADILIQKGRVEEMKEG